ncbi:MAG: hypothetical protein H6598_02955 [Flavobacteriales bacterium]|nr:hypothetical protein [Flavobacteriales bacterium]
MAFRKKQYSDSELLEKLKDGSLPALDFTHEAHVRLVWILKRSKFDKFTFYDVSRIIKNYANAIGEGQIYHETLTFASVMIILDRIKESKAKDFFEFIEDNLDLILEFKKLVSQHYSDERIQSEEARTTIVSPDRVPF